MHHFITKTILFASLVTSHAVVASQDVPQTKDECIKYINDMEFESNFILLLNHGICEEYTTVYTALEDLLQGKSFLNNSSVFYKALFSSKNCPVISQWSDDTNTFEGKKLEKRNNFLRLFQTAKKQTVDDANTQAIADHILWNGNSSCIIS